MDLDGLLCYGFSLSPVILRLALVVPVLLFGSSPVKGEFQVIGSLEPIVAAPGDDVILPCHVEPPLNVMGLTVEWSRTDLRPDPADQLSRVEYVHLYRERSEVPDMKISSYIRRTALFTDDLRHGNISLKITNVTKADEGEFRCFLPKLKSHKQFSVVRLVIESNTAEARTTETPLQPVTPDLRKETDVKGVLSSRNWLVSVGVSCVFVVILVAAVTRYLTQKCRKQEFKTVPAV